MAETDGTLHLKDLPTGVRYMVRNCSPCDEAWIVPFPSQDRRDNFCMECGTELGTPTEMVQ